MTLMHVCGSHEQVIARFGLRAAFPAGLRVIMGPGCPVCVTDQAEVDAAVALALQGARLATYGDVLRLPGTSRSLLDAQGEGARVEVVYSILDAVELARRSPSEEVVFFATGFETTAVTTAAVLLTGVPDNFSVLSAHRYIPPAMELVAGLPGSEIQGFVAAGHAAAITGAGIFEPLAARQRLPVVVAGFEPLDVMAALVELAVLVRERRAEVVNLYPRVVTREGNRTAQEKLWRVFEPAGGRWRGIGDVPGGSLALTASFAHADARRRFRLDGASPDATSGRAASRCICGAIMTGARQPSDCPLFANACTPDTPLGACMVSSEGSCRIWHVYGGVPDLAEVG